MNLTDTDNLMKLLSEEKEITDKPDAEELVDAKGEIELDHVCLCARSMRSGLHGRSARSISPTTGE
jgi:ABC-type transport system involved in Fe-S cluster assembly fused permease/ATPase subunit